MNNTQNKLNSINEAIENSNKSYFERNEDLILQDIKDSREKLLNGEDNFEEFDLDVDLEYDYSSYIFEADIIAEELQYNPSDSFQIGNNRKGGI